MTIRSLILVATLCYAAVGLALAAPVTEPQVRGMSFGVFIRLEHGMTQGELVLRAGNPDHESVDSRHEGVKMFSYFPTSAAPFLTTVTLRSGRIVAIERLRKRF